MTLNILICGVGGQGIILASRIIAAAAVSMDIPAMSAETIGMAQKGGSVVSFLRLGEGLSSPMFAEGAGDLLLALEPAEAVRMLPYLKAGGRLIVNKYPVMPAAGSGYDETEMLDYIMRSVERPVIVDGEAGCRFAGSPGTLNMVMLGAAARHGSLPFPLETLDDVMRRTVKPRFYETNHRALFYGKD